ncbi:MAG: phosphatase PAP2 family protein [Bdellovibrionota bacterium]
MFSPEIQSLDEKILLTIQRFRFKPFTWLMILFTWTGAGKFWWSVALILNGINYFAMIINPYALRAFFAPLLVWAINWFLKRKFKRDRPCTRRKDILALVKMPPCDSFPSSHAGSTFSFFFILLWWEFPEAQWFGVWAAIVSFSRMYLGVHYLSDILGGILVGLISSGIIYFIF